jgi:hypothetical protein
MYSLHLTIFQCCERRPEVIIDMDALAPLVGGAVQVMLGSMAGLQAELKIAAVFSNPTRQPGRGYILSITNAIQDHVECVACIPVDDSGEEPDVCIIELGGPVEAAPFVEASISGDKNLPAHFSGAVKSPEIARKSAGNIFFTNTRNTTL